ncbi:hypothetical protein CW304_19765 [Bacillus sp. UFRGS-B20]|nr:hypothetical protein CW304_19765 [Bacillus sp. UFRGS-B20]
MFFNGSCISHHSFIYKGIFYYYFFVSFINGDRICNGTPHVLDALITQGIEKEQRGTVTFILQVQCDLIGVGSWTTFIFFFMKGADLKVFLFD